MFSEAVKLKMYNNNNETMCCLTLNWFQECDCYFMKQKQKFHNTVSFIRTN